jgi:hypothetical protein
MNEMHAVEEHKLAEEPKVVEEPKLAEELEKMPYEPLLPIEKKLVLGSVLLGLFLLCALVAVTQLFLRH